MLKRDLEHLKGKLSNLESQKISSLISDDDETIFSKCKSFQAQKPSCEIQTIENYKNEKLKNLIELQAKTEWPEFKTEPINIGKIKSRGINNENDVFMGPYGGVFYKSRVSGVETYLKKNQRVKFNE